MVANPVSANDHTEKLLLEQFSFGYFMYSGGGFPICMRSQLEKSVNRDYMDSVSI